MKTAMTAVAAPGPGRGPESPKPRLVTTYGTGETWTELPGDHHLVSANASQTAPAKILAVFVADDQDTVLTKPDQR